MAATSTEIPGLFTIGHSNHTEEKFLGLFREHDIDVLVDVRSQPLSRYNPQFNSNNLEMTLTAAGVRYIFMGDQLGGRPDGEEFCDGEGYVLYNRVAEAPFFLKGIERLEEVNLCQRRVAIMCSEEDPAVCHRHLLVARVMADHGVHVQHIRGDGKVQSEDEIRPQHRQSMLFAEMEQESWRSLRSVLPRHQPPSSLGS